MKNLKTAGLAATLTLLTAATAFLPAVAANADDWGGRGGDRHDAPRNVQARDRDGYVERQRVTTTERVERDGYRDSNRGRDNFRGRDGYVERGPVVVREHDRYAEHPVVVREHDRYDEHPVIVHERDRYDGYREPAPVVVVHDRYDDRDRYSEPAPVVIVRDHPRENLQQAKNNARNVATVGLAAAAVGVLTHNTTLTAVGAIGAVAAGAAYENDRHAQSERQAYRDSRDNRGW